MTHGVVEKMLAEPGELHVVVVSPARPLYDGRARFVAIEALGGQLGIAPQHAALVAALGTGPLRIETVDGQTERFAIRKGFLKTGGSKVTILAGDIVKPDEVDESEVRGELDDVIDELRHPASDEDFTELLDRRAWCQTRLNLRR